MKRSLLFIAIFFFLLQNGNTQPGYTAGKYIRTAFLRDSIETSGNAFSFNSILISNISGRDLQLTVSAAPLYFVELITEATRTVNLPKNDSIRLPLRFLQNKKEILATGWQVFVLHLKGLNASFDIATQFYIKPFIYRKWKVMLPQQEIFIREAGVISFPVVVMNKGNTSDAYSIKVESALPIRDSSKNFFFRLLPGDSKSQLIHIEPDKKQLATFTAEYISLTITNGTGEKNLLIQKVTKISDRLTDVSTSRKQGLSGIELHSTVFGSGRADLFIRAKGYILEDDKQQLYFNYQSGNLSGNRYSTSQQILEYRSRQVRLTAGTMLLVNAIPTFGEGLNLQYTPGKRSAYEIAYIKGKYRPGTQFYLRIKQPLGKHLHIETKNLFNRTRSRGTRSFINENDLQYVFNQQLRLGIKTGTGIERIKTRGDTVSLSNMAGYYLEKTGKRLQVNIRGSRYEGNYPGINKGISTTFYNIRYRFRRLSIGSYFEKNYLRPVVSSYLLNYPAFYYSQEGINGKISYHAKRFECVLTPGRYREKQDSLNAFTTVLTKVTSSFKISGRKWNAGLTNSFTKAGIPEEKLAGNIYSWGYTFNLQTKASGLAVRGNSGPIEYYEYKKYLLNQAVKKINIAIFNNAELPKLNLKIFNELNYSRYGYLNLNSLIVSTRMAWSLPDKGIGASMQLNLNLSQTSHSVISFFVRKELDLFISQKKKAKRKLLLFCDNNNNGIKDAGEPALSYFRIMLEHQLIETNKHGEVLLENIPEQGIRIDIDGTSFQEWIPAGGYAQRIEKVMNGVIMLPFSRAGSIKGRLVVKRDKMSSSFTDIHGIRITATTAAGKTYTTLTDSEGRYMLNLPVNVYRVSINSKAINNGFSIIDPQQVVDLLQNSQPDLDFIIVQEKRQLNIKKQ